MKTKISNPVQKPDGFALMMVLIMSGLGLVVLTGAMNWTSSSARMTERNNQLSQTVYAAEAATEKIVSQVIRDYKVGGESVVYNNLSSYQATVPTSSDFAGAADFEFNNAQGTASKTHVARITTQQYQPLDSQYEGLYGYVSTYRILSNAKLKNARYDIPAAVQQDVQVASIPIFQFAIFYSGLLEFTWAAPLAVRGRVHSNNSIYTGSTASADFYEDVTSVGTDQKTAWWGYTLSQFTGALNFYKQKDTNVAALTLPIGTNNTAQAVHAVIEQPPTSEAMTSTMGQQRYYNKAELVIAVSNNAVNIKVKNPFDASPSTINWANASYFVTTNKTFTDQREGKTMRTTELDIAKMITWAATNTTVIAKLGSGKPPNLLYVVDYRSVTSSQKHAVRLINAATIPSRGLTFATPNPLYTVGHFNCPTSAHAGTTNTSNARPASLVSDAWTALSSSWSDGASGGSFTKRVAANTTVNAAILTGNVPSAGSGGNSPKSGGAMNLPRLLEDWSNKTLTVNGSLVCMFSSTEGTGAFQMPGGYYYAPSRNFNFDPNFFDVTKQPPGTPELRVLIRSKWVTPPVNTINYSGT